MNYKKLIKTLETIDVDECYPIYIPSHLRPGHLLYQTVLQLLPKDFRKKKVHYIVRDEMYKKYKKAQPDVDIVVIPKKLMGPGAGLDTTRKFLYDYALENGDKQIFDFDDDNTDFTACYSHGETTRRLRKADKEEYMLQILTLASIVARESFHKYKKLCLGSFGTITPSCCSKDFHRGKIVINKGSCPRQALIINLAKLKKLGAERNGAYDKQAEDMGMAFNAINHGGWLFYLPTILRKTEPASDDKNPRTENLIFGEDDRTLWVSGLQAMKDSGVKPEYIRWKKWSHGLETPFGINWNGVRKYHPDAIAIEEEW